MGAILLYNRLRDSPESMGLAPVEKYYAQKHGQTIDVVEKSDENIKPERLGMTLYKHVFSSPAIWIVSLANFFLCMSFDIQ